MAPSDFDIAVCGQWPGTAPSGAALLVRCADDMQPARYVIIFGIADVMNICQLEVYGQGNYKIIYSMAFAGNLCLSIL